MVKPVACALSIGHYFCPLIHLKPCVHLSTGFGEPRKMWDIASYSLWIWYTLMLSVLFPVGTFFWHKVIAFSFHFVLFFFFPFQIPQSQFFIGSPLVIWTESSLFTHGWVPFEPRSLWITKHSPWLCSPSRHSLAAPPPAAAQRST